MSRDARSSSSASEAASASAPASTAAPVDDDVDGRLDDVFTRDKNFVSNPMPMGF